MSRKFPLEIKSPDGKNLIDQAEILNVRLTDGEVGVLYGHLPMIGVIDISHFDYLKDGKTYEFAISGGILNVTKDKVMVLADSFESREEIDISRAKEAEKRAQELIDKAKDNQQIDIKRAELALRRALNRLSLTNK